ncbi:MAG: hypothetical protein QGI21_04520 [Candidatus Poseidoniaceae archaeon]|jgi:hypothetical protein|nr:hypothetical protein [Candidatus Poseidoniaceae archaeon]
MGEGDSSGAETVERLGRRDLNNNGKVINLAISGNSRFYNFEWLNEKITSWISQNDKPDLLILGGASGIDCLVERWAAENSIPTAVFNEAWNQPRRGLRDTGRPEAAPGLVDIMLDHATHVLAFPGPKSKWTSIMIKRAQERGINADEFPTPLELENQ